MNCLWGILIRRCFFFVSAKERHICASGESAPLGAFSAALRLFVPVFGFPGRSVVHRPRKPPHFGRYGGFRFTAPVVDRRIGYVVHDLDPIVARHVAHSVEQVVAVAEQRFVLAGRRRSTGELPFGLRPRVQSSVDEAALSEVVLKVPFAMFPTRMGILRRISVLISFCFARMSFENSLISI